MSYYLVFYSGDVKPHFVPAALREHVLAELRRRFPQVREGHAMGQRGEVIGIDRGGAVFINATQVDVPMAGSQFRIPVRDIEFYYAELLAAEPRFAGGHEFYKLHGNLHCIVLSADQRRLALYAWEQMLGAASAAAVAENIQWQRVAADLAHKPNIVINFEPPSYPQDN